MRFKKRIRVEHEHVLVDAIRQIWTGNKILSNGHKSTPLLDTRTLALPTLHAKNKMHAVNAMVCSVGPHKVFIYPFLLYSKGRSIDSWSVVTILTANANSTNTLHTLYLI